MIRAVDTCDNYKREYSIGEKNYSSRDIVRMLENKYGLRQGTRGDHKQFELPTGKVCGLRKFDKVRYRGGTYFIKGRMSTGYALLMDIEQQTQKFTKPKTPKMSQMERVGARKSWIMIEQGLCDSFPT